VRIAVPHPQTIGWFSVRVTSWWIEESPYQPQLPSGVTVVVSGSEFGYLSCSAFASFTDTSNPHILHKSFHIPQPILSAYWNIADDD
jgi:hypothetical protein